MPPPLKQIEVKTYGFLLTALRSSREQNFGVIFDFLGPFLTFWVPNGLFLGSGLGP